MTSTPDSSPGTRFASMTSSSSRAMSTFTVNGRKRSRPRAALSRSWARASSSSESVSRVWSRPSVSPQPLPQKYGVSVTSYDGRESTSSWWFLSTMKPRSAGTRSSFTKFSSARSLYSSPRRIWSWYRRTASTRNAMEAMSAIHHVRGLSSFCAAPEAAGGGTPTIQGSLSDASSSKEARLLAREDCIHPAHQRQDERGGERRQERLEGDPPDEREPRGRLGGG